MDNNSNDSIIDRQNETERSSLLSHASLTENDKFDPKEIAADPAAAENFNIEKRFLSAAFDKINSPSAMHCTGVKSLEDSFDWLEDDKDLYEITKGLYTGPPVTLKSKSSLYDNAQPDNPQAIRLDEFYEDDDENGEEEEDDDAYWLIPKKVYYGAIIIIQIVLLALSALTLSGYDLGMFTGLPLYYWTLLGSLIVFAPFLSSWSLKLLVKGLRHSGTVGSGELPNFLDTLRMPLVMFISTLTVFHFWFKYFPKDCPPSENPVSFCFYENADKIYYGLVITSFGFATEIILMFFATLKFHERTFKTRIINCRFKIYVVQQLALKALSAEHQRTTGIDENGRRILSSASQNNLNMQEQGDETSYFKELIKIIKGFFSPSTIISGGQQAIGTAANFVQIQVEDSAATVPVALSSSQSYGKFSKKLKKHMKLYGYSQFSQNKSGLKDTESRILARDLFHFLCPLGKNNLNIEDLSTCFASARSAQDAYEIFDQDQDGTITKKEFRNTIVAIYADLRDLTKSIRTAGHALQKLDLILKLVFVSGLALIVLTLFSINITNILTLSLSIVIGLNFIIGDLAKHFLSSLILLFVNHPFDIGDTIVVGLFEEGCYLKDILTVKQMNLMNTVFTRWNGQETYVPNHMLANAPFMTNLSRTVEQWEMIEFKIPSMTPESVLSDLRRNIGAFLQMHEKYYFKVFDMHAIVAADMAESEKNIDELEFNLRVKCKPTSDAQKRWVRHAKLLKFIKVTLDKTIHEAVAKELINQ